MLKQTMIEIDENVLRQKFCDQNNVLHEYEAIVSSLKEELNNCKADQSKLRLEIETLRKENDNVNDTIHRSLMECNHENGNENVHEKEILTNLEKRITILQMEKDSIFQLWQMALKAIDVLEEELRTVHREDKSTKFYQEHINNIKESYSEAIKILESKLTSAKENFFQQQTLWEKSKEKIDQLTKEKSDIIQQLNVSQQQALEKEKNHQTTINSLTEDLYRIKSELEQIKLSKIDLEEKLKNAQTFATVMISKDHEAKSKVSEAVDLVESVVKEKNEILKREAQVVDEKNRLETRLATLSEEYTKRLETEVVKAKESYSKNIKKYLLEIKELKAKLREQGTLLDRSQREYRLVEEELERVRRDSENFIQKQNVRVLSLEQTLQQKELRSNAGEGNRTAVHDDKINYLERQINHLQEQLLSTSDKLRQVHLQSSRDAEDHARESDGRTREIMEKCSNFERQLSRTLMDKESLASNLHMLETSFEKEMQKRHHEKILLENKIKELQDKITNAESASNGLRMFQDSISNKRHIGQQTTMNLDSITNILALQEKFDKKTKELTQHVEAHQQLSNKWKEEATLLTSKFQKRSQEFKNKISALQKQNEDLTRELLFYQQLLARCNTQIVQNYSRDTETR